MNKVKRMHDEISAMLTLLLTKVFSHLGYTDELLCLCQPSEMVLITLVDVSLSGQIVRLVAMCYYREIYLSPDCRHNLFFWHQNEYRGVRNWAAFQLLHLNILFRFQIAWVLQGIFQSPAAGGVKLTVALVAYSPCNCDVPVDGRNHQALACDPAIDSRATEIVRNSGK